MAVNQVLLNLLKLDFGFLDQFQPKIGLLLGKALGEALDNLLGEVLGEQMGEPECAAILDTKEKLLGKNKPLG